MKKLISSIPLSRLTTYLLVAGLLPLICILLILFSQNQKISSMELVLDSVEQTAWTTERRQSQNNAVRQHYRETDHFYIDKHLETITLLESEIESLQKIASNTNVGQSEQVTKRLDQLTGPANSMQFTEGVVVTYPYFQETIETLSHSVEVNVNDLQNILAKIEGIEIGNYGPAPDRPQLIITDFKLEKKKVRDNNEVFLLQLKLLKREYL
jgi:hypothetical protein